VSESLELFNEVDQLRREVRAMRTEVKAELSEIRGRVDSTLTRQNAELALTLGGNADDGTPAEVLLRRGGMDYFEIAALTGSKPNAVRMKIKRWEQRQRG
jgi:hypothetical protein